MTRAPLLLAVLAGCAAHAPATVPASSSPPAPVAAAPVPPAPKPEPKPTLRLPADVRPVRAQLSLQLDPRKEQTSGEVTYELQLAKPSSLVWINATDLQISSVRFDGVEGEVVPGDVDFLGLRPPHPVGPGKVTVALRFTGKVDQVRSRGIYRGDEGNDAYLYTFFESIDARRAFPCFDEPGFKLPWTLKLRVPSADVALANTAQVSEEDLHDGTKQLTFAESRPLPSYLVAFGVGPFEVLDGGTVGDFKTPFRIALPRGRAKEARYALASTSRIISVLEQYFGMPYPWGKLDVLVPPRYWGTMEHPGIVALGQPISLIKPSDETTARKQFYVTIAGHELGHYWFGDYVTMAWWDDTWLNEALGEWMDAKVSTGFEPSWKSWNDRLAETENARIKDGLSTAKAIRQPVTTKEAIWSSFDADLTYRKGAAVIRMFETWLGEDQWRDFIRAYMAAHAWGNATTADFLKLMGEKFSPQTAAAFQTFLTQPGLPLIHAELKCDGAPRLSLRQTRYQPLGQSAPAEQWQVPVCVRTEAGRSCTLLSSTEGELALADKQCPKWVSLNADGTGYYRVDYTPQSARAVFAHLQPAERTQLGSDVAALVRAGKFGLGEALGLVPMLAQSGDKHTVLASFGIIGQLHPLDLSDAQYVRYSHFIAKTFGPRARALGWTPVKGESDDATALRRTLVAAVARTETDRALIARAHTLATQWLDHRTGVSDDLVAQVLWTAARNGDRAFFDRLVAEARKPNLDRRDRSRLLGALGAFKDPALVKEALALMPSFDVREALQLGQMVLRSREHRELGWTTLQAQFDTTATKLRGDEVGSLISAADGFCDPAHRQQVQSFFSPRVKTIDGGPLTLAATLGHIDSCIAERQASEAEVARFLSRY